MAWTEPKINWNENYEPSPEDMNRIEENTYALKNENIEIDGEKTFKEDVTFEKDVEVGGDVTVDGGLDVDGNTTIDDATVDGTLTVTGALSAPTLNTGHGYNELYAMNQNVRTTDKVEFTSVTAPHFVTGYAIGNRSEDALFGLLASHIPNTGNRMVISGGIKVGSNVYIVSSAYRDSSSRIFIYGMHTNDGTASIVFVDNGGAFEYELSLAW